MQPVVVDFEKRVSEIETYFKHLTWLSNLNPNDSRPWRGRKLGPDEELEKVLKANVFLLLYNLVESTIRQALTALADAVARERLPYGEVRAQIQQIWLRTEHGNFKNLGTSEIFNRLRGLNEEIVDLKFNQKLATGGNLDARKIRDFAAEYGFSSAVHHRAKHGEALFLIKKRRNDLGHGLESFAECGRQYSVPQLDQMKRETVTYLRSILRNINQYIERSGYRTE